MAETRLRLGDARDSGWSSARSGGSRTRAENQDRGS
jgi:hypothetical protein